MFVVAPETVVITLLLVTVPSVTSDPSNCHWKVKSSSPVDSASIIKAASSPERTLTLLGCDVIVINGSTVIVPIPELRGSLVAYPVT